MIPVTGGQLIRRGKNGYFTYRLALPNRQQKWIALHCGDLAQAKVKAAQIWLDLMSERFNFSLEILRNGGVKFSDVKADEVEAVQALLESPTVKEALQKEEAAPGLSTLGRETPCLKLSEAYQEFRHEKINITKTWKPATVIASDAALSVFMELAGDLPMREYTDAIFRQFKHDLLVIPPHRKTSPKWRDKSLSEILALAPGGQSVKNLNKTINFIGAFFDWYVKSHRDILDRHILKDLLLRERKTTADHEERTHFTDDQVALFYNQSLKDRRLTPFRFWAVVLGAYTGARIGELAQLKITDIVEIESIPCIRIQEGEGQSTKTLAAQRLIPIHPKLIDLGLLNYVKELKREGKTEWLWREMDGVDDKPDTASSWGQRTILKTKGLPEGACFHSLRHTCATKLSHSLAKIGLPATYEMDLLGHSRSGSEGQIRYEKTLLSEKLKAIQSIEYNVKWTPWPGLPRLTPRIDQLLATRNLRGSRR